MHIILRYPNGKRVDALLLCREQDQMRVMVHGRNDTLELEFIRDRWVDDDGQKVSIEAMVADRYDGGLQTNTKYSATAAAMNTAAPARRSRMAGRTD
jgi:hypothetical protein